MDVLFRTARNADAPRVLRLVADVLAEYGLSLDPEETDADLADIADSYLHDGGMFEVVEAADGTLLGSVGLFPRGDGVCELRKMYLAPEARGQGLGRALLERALEHARRAGFRRVELETASCLTDAIRLYTRYGFRPVAARHLAARCDQAYALDLSEETG